jgi:hypothetical protein
VRPASRRALISIPLLGPPARPPSWVHIGYRGETCARTCTPEVSIASPAAGDSHDAIIIATPDRFAIGSRDMPMRIYERRYEPPRRYIMHASRYGLFENALAAYRVTRVPCVCDLTVHRGLGRGGGAEKAVPECERKYERASARLCDYVAVARRVAVTGGAGSSSARRAPGSGKEIIIDRGRIADASFSWKNFLNATTVLSFVNFTSLQLPADTRHYISSNFILTPSPLHNNFLSSTPPPISLLFSPLAIIIHK